MDNYEMELYCYRMVNKAFQGDWRLARSMQEVDSEVEERNAEGGKYTWSAEVNIIKLAEQDVRHIGGFLIGHIKSDARAKASKANGRKGGRPKKIQS